MKVHTGVDSSDEASVQDAIVEDPDPTDRLKTILPEINLCHAPRSSCLNWTADSSNSESDTSSKRLPNHEVGKTKRKSIWLHRKVERHCKQRYQDQISNQLNAQTIPLPASNVPSDRTWSAVEAFHYPTDNECADARAICSEPIYYSNGSKGHRGNFVRNVFRKMCHRISHKNLVDTNSKGIISEDVQGVTQEHPVLISDEPEMPIVEVFTDSAISQHADESRKREERPASCARQMTLTDEVDPLHRQRKNITDFTGAASPPQSHHKPNQMGFLNQELTKECDPQTKTVISLVTTSMQENKVQLLSNKPKESLSNQTGYWWMNKTEEEVRSILRTRLKQKNTPPSLITPEQEMEYPEDKTGLLKLTPHLLSQILSDPYVHLYYFFIDCRIHPRTQAFKKRTVPGAISLEDILDCKERISKQSLRKHLRQRYKQLVQSTAGSQTEPLLYVILIVDMNNTTHPVKNQIILEEIGELVSREADVLEKSADKHSVYSHQNYHTGTNGTKSMINQFKCFRVDFDEIRKQAPWILSSIKYNAHMCWITPPLKLARGQLWLWQDSQYNNTGKCDEKNDHRENFGPLRILIKRYDLDCIIVVTADTKVERDRWIKGANLKRTVIFISHHCLSDANRLILVVTRILQFFSKPDDVLVSDNDSQWLPVKQSQISSKILVTDGTVNNGVTFCLGFLMLLLPCSFSSAYSHFLSLRPHPNRNFVDVNLLKSLNAAILKSLKVNLFPSWKVFGKRRKRKSLRTTDSSNPLEKIAPFYYSSSSRNNSELCLCETGVNTRNHTGDSQRNIDLLDKETLDRLEQFKASQT
ncbi:hypothetical protein D915_005673 [Fasciola hepatica]|uniref:Uncharacterized protein n=1 Tax=Fasciola hepatica TaxID=6192 RepID=A0A4E0RZU0_FASHE|nr:hypothetical protein D915_005673 [Fasciola hepatica]